MTSSSLLVIFSLLAFITIASSQPQQDYLKACTAILKGFDAVDSPKTDYDYSFAEWENPSPRPPFMQFFKNDKGLMSKIYTKNNDDNTWTFNLIVYDGYVIDSRFAQVQINLKYLQDTSFNQASGTFATSNSMKFTISTGDLFEVKNQKVAIGPISISFINANTNQSFTQFDKNTKDLQGYTFSLNFLNHPDYGTLRTSSFAKTYPIPEVDKKIALISVGISILFSCLSWYTRNLSKKVSLVTLRAYFASASYIAYWAIIQPQYHGFWYWILLIAPVFNWIKILVFIILDKKLSRSEVIMTLLIALVALLNHVPLIWMKIMDIFPVVLMMIPAFEKITKGDEAQAEMSRFEVTNTLNILLWMMYVYAYPGNLYLFDWNLLLLFWTFLFTLPPCMIYCGSQCRPTGNYYVNDAEPPRYDHL